MEPLIRKRDIVDEADMEEPSPKRPRREDSISGQYDEQQTDVTPSTSAGTCTPRMSNLNVTPSPSTKHLVPRSVTPNTSSRWEIAGSASYLLSNFTIDWNQIGAEIINEMNACISNNKPLSVQTYNRLTALIVEQVRNVASKIPFKIFLNLALDAVKKYPILLDCDEKGNVMGDGSASLAEKLRNIAKGKCLAGIKNSYYNSGSQECSRNLIASLKHCTSENLTENILNSTLSFLRYKLDNTELVQLVQEIPIVRHYKFITHHFMAATGCNPSDFNSNYDGNRRRIIKALKKKCKSKITSSSSDMVIFEAISKTLKENIQDLVKVFEVNYIIDVN